MAVIVALLVAAAVGLGGTMGLDAVLGDNIMPDDSLYGLERAGEAINLGLGLASHRDVALERIREAESLARKGNDVRAEEMLAQAEDHVRDISGENAATVTENIRVARDNIQRGAYR